MDKKQIVMGFDLFNAKYLYFNLSENKSLDIYLKLMDGKIIKIEFDGIVYFSCKLGGAVKNLYELLDELILNELISSIYKSISPKRSLKLFEIEDINGIPIFKILAKSINLF